MNRTERIDDMLNLMNVDVGTIEDKADWLNRMRALCRTAIVLAYADEEVSQFIGQFAEAIEDYIGVKDMELKYKNLLFEEE